MNKEEKELLLKDLCARIPYGVMVCEDYYEHKRTLPILDCGVFFIIDHTERVKPFLRPMSSMTEEEKIEYCELQDRFLCSSQYPVTNAFEMFDWLNAHHFDYRGLIEKGLGIDCTNLNIY